MVLTQRSIIKAINTLTETHGIRTFRKSFSVILTDNRSRFKNLWDNKNTEFGTHRTYVFYWDPHVSSQKACLKKNHEHIRSKGHNMYRYTQDNINLIISHINSTTKESLNDAHTPFWFDHSAFCRNSYLLLLKTVFTKEADCLWKVVIQRLKNKKMY